MLTILAALNDEIRIIRSHMEIDEVIHMRPFTISIGRYERTNIALVLAGVGREAAKTATQYCIQNLNPSIFINIGYAGGIDPRQHTGDIILPNSIIEEASGRNFEVEDDLTEKGKQIADGLGIACHSGRIVTVDRPLVTPHEKAFIGTQFEATACDMESSGIAHVATESNIPFFVARSILDPLDTTLPLIPETAIVRGKVALGALAGYLRQNPKDILKLPKFSFMCNRARDNITSFLKAWVANEKKI